MGGDVDDAQLLRPAGLGVVAIDVHDRRAVGRPARLAVGLVGLRGREVDVVRILVVHRQEPEVPAIAAIVVRDPGLVGRQRAVDHRAPELVEAAAVGKPQHLAVAGIGGVRQLAQVGAVGGDRERLLRLGARTGRDAAEEHAAVRRPAGIEILGHAGVARSRMIADVARLAGHEIRDRDARPVLAVPVHERELVAVRRPRELRQPVIPRRRLPEGAPAAPVGVHRDDRVGAGHGGELAVRGGARGSWDSQQ
jgi:hypothetical protein